MSPTFLDILRSGRVHTAMATAAIPAIACIALSGDPIAVGLVVIGAIMHHAWGFSLNEIMDLDVDKKNPDLGDKPLVSGRISKREGYIISFAFLILSILSFAVAGLLFSAPFFMPLIFIGTATVCGTIYDIWGKRFPLSDIFMAGWMFFLVLAGVFSSGKVEGLPFPAIAIATLGGLQILFNNSVEGGLKDVRNDRTSGTRTLAVTLGARYEQKILRPGKGMIVWGTSLRILYVLFGAAASLVIADIAGWGEWIVIATAVIGIILFLHSLNYLRMELKIRRSDLLKVFAKHEVLSFLLLIIIMMPAVGWIPSIFLFILPLFSYLVMNRIMFGTGLAPKV